MPVTISGNGTVTGAQVGYNAVATITATDASWTVPALADPVVKVTVVGGGGGGAGYTTNGSAGGSSSFVSAAGTATALGGLGGRSAAGASNYEGRQPYDGFVSSNFGTNGYAVSIDQPGQVGLGGQVVFAYYDLTGISTVNVTIGAGGAAGDNASASDGADGGDGIVIVEYRAG